MATGLLHYLKRPGLGHLNGLYVDVADSDRDRFSSIPNAVVRGPYFLTLLKYHDRYFFHRSVEGPVNHKLFATIGFPKLRSG